MAWGPSSGAPQEAALSDHQRESSGMMRNATQEISTDDNDQMWRPCKPITRDPFAVSDATSIPDEHIIKVPLIFPDHTAEALEVVPAPDPQKPHRYYYKFNQHPDDLLFFIQVDSSKQPGVPRRCPHVAFKDPNLDESKGEPRISIETRAMVFYDQDEA